MPFSFIPFCVHPQSDKSVFLTRCQRRNQQDCELYEATMTNDCRVECMASLFLSETTIRGSDDSPRRLSACQRGDSCMKTLTSRNGFNVSVHGYCDACNCIPSAAPLYTPSSVISLRNSTSQQVDPLKSRAECSRVEHRSGTRTVGLPKNEMSHNVEIMDSATF